MNFVGHILLAGKPVLCLQVADHWVFLLRQQLGELRALRAVLWRGEGDNASLCEYGSICFGSRLECDPEGQGAEVRVRVWLGKEIDTALSTGLISTHTRPCHQVLLQTLPLSPPAAVFPVPQLVTQHTQRFLFFLLRINYCYCCMSNIFVASLPPLTTSSQPSNPSSPSLPSPPPLLTRWQSLPSPQMTTASGMLWRRGQVSRKARLRNLVKTSLIPSLLGTR